MAEINSLATVLVQIAKNLPKVLSKKKSCKKNHGPWSLLPEGLLVLVLIFSESVLPGPYMSGPYKMIMRVYYVYREIK